MHAMEFSGLAALVAMGLRRSNAVVPPLRLFLVPWGFATFYGLSDEIHQIFVPLRTFDLLDLVADSAGAALACGLLRRYAWRLDKGVPSGK